MWIVWRFDSRASWRSSRTSSSARRTTAEGGRQLMRPRRLMNQINVVPYVDVMLVLLVIFMVTAPLVTTGVIDLPSVGKSARPPVAPLEVIIRVDMSLMLRERMGGQAGGSGGQMQERRGTTAELVVPLRGRPGGKGDHPLGIP